MADSSKSYKLGKVGAKGSTLLVVPPDGDGKIIYSIPHELYTSPDLALPSQGAGIVKEMIKYGTALAYVPNIGVGIGAECFLVNLRSLKT